MSRSRPLSPIIRQRLILYVPFVGSAVALWRHSKAIGKYEAAENEEERQRAFDATWQPFHDTFTAFGSTTVGFLVIVVASLIVKWVVQ